MKSVLGAMVASAAALSLSACGSGAQSGAAHAVPWLAQPAQSAASSVSAVAAPSCTSADLQVSAQKWNGVGQGEATGNFDVSNSSSSPCDLPFPTAVVADTASGDIDFDTRNSGFAADIVMPPGDEVSVLVGAPFDCSAAPQMSTAFKVSFGQAAITMTPAVMGVQCGGDVEDFEDRNLVSAPPTTSQSLLQVRIDAPTYSVDPGSQAYFQVTLTNPTTADISLSPCPGYQMGMKGMPGSDQMYTLNCAGAGGVIEAGASQTFQMQYSVPANGISDSGGYFTWHLLVPDDPSNSSQNATAHLLKAPAGTASQ